MSSHLAGRRSLGASAALTLALGTGFAASLLLAGPAGAATPSATAAFSPTDHAIVYTAAAGQANKVSVTASRADGSAQIDYLIHDVVPITAGDGCTYPSGSDHTAVSCAVDALDSQDPYATFKLDLGDGDDTVAYDNATDDEYYFADIDLGAGNDTLTQTGSVDGNSVDGGTGADNLTVGPDAVVLGGDGDDTIHAAAGSIAQGGNDNDTIYSNGDSASADGGAGDDVIHGGDGAQSLDGGADNDQIYGGTGDDLIHGGTGNDVLYGNSGNDTIYGNSGDDQLYGGPGQDVLSGGPGKNVVHQD